MSEHGIEGEHLGEVLVEGTGQDLVEQLGAHTTAPPMSAEVLPGEWAGRFGDDSPSALRMNAARAMLPMPPGILVHVLAFLSHDSDSQIAEAAKKSVADLPEGFLLEVLTGRETHPAILDHYGRVLVNDDRFTEGLILNPATADDTIRYMASNMKSADRLEVIARNQVRFLRYPAIVEALYYNPETRMGSISRVIETAARHEISLHHIPGFKEVEASILGDSVLRQKQEEGELTEKEIEELEASENESSLNDDAFRQMLREASEEVEEYGATTDLDESKKPIWRAIAEMSPAQKVRLALTGNASARKLLVRDPKRIVNAAVLKNPRLTDQEVMYFANQKSLSDEVIRTIAKNREWTRLYGLKLALIRNPKTPTQMSMWFIKSVFPKDLQNIAKDKDVPGFIQKTARRMLQQKDRKSR